MLNRNDPSLPDGEVGCHGVNRGQAFIGLSSTWGDERVVDGKMAFVDEASRTPSDFVPPRQSR